MAAALGLGPSVVRDHFAVGTATLSLLATVAETRPLLALVDDSHWVDSASIEALLFDTSGGLATVKRILGRLI